MTRAEDNLTVSVCHEPGLGYPEAEDYFSPDQPFPEYRWGHLAAKPNGVYAAVRNCLAAAGLDAGNFGKPAWNPLRKYISPGQNVFLLCNFVKHNDQRVSDEAFFAKCTHGSVLRPLIDYVLLALEGRGSVRFGNAPLQSCDWGRVAAETGALRVRDFYAGRPLAQARVELADLRGHVIVRGPLGGMATVRHAAEPEDSAAIDLAADSLLEAHYRGGRQPRFRVQDYDPQRTENCHCEGRHVYFINRRLLQSDVILSVPKLKTHEKVGITCGLKGCVGSVAHKDCLAHHRYGPPRVGGDEYPDKLAVLGVFSAIHESANLPGRGLPHRVMRSVDYFSRKLVRRFTRALGGAWPGNDTCWRMTLDLARILEYADQTGRLGETRRRRHLLFTDGIIGGEGNGPLSPKPVRFGYLCFSESLPMGDYVNCLAMGYDPMSLPLIRGAFGLGKYPLCDLPPAACGIRVNGRPATLGELAQGLGVKFLPPREWRGAL